jgi:hypothetical protein
LQDRKPNGYLSSIVLSPAPRTEQIPPITRDVDEHGDPAVLLRAWSSHEFDAGGHHPVVGRIEVVDPEEETDSSAKLVSDHAALLVTIGTSQQDAGLCSPRSHDNPSLGSTIVGEGGGVFGQVESENTHEEPYRPVVIVNDDGDEL